MFYGRRRIDPSLVLPSRKKRWILDRNFQVHYTSYLTMAVSGASLLTFGVVLYFVHENFNIFTALAYDTHPGLVQHLEREVTWLNFFSGVSLVLITLTTLILTLRTTRRLMEPLARVEKHMRKLTQGYWNVPDLHGPESEFNELLTTYDYFYRSLKIMTENELELLKKLNIDPSNREAYAAWKSLLELKTKRLGKKMSQESGLKSLPPVTATVEESAASRPLRRVS